MEDIIDINTLFGPLPEASADLSVDVLLGMMAKHKIRAACTLSTLGILLDSSVGNAATRAACGDHPELIPTATVNPTTFFGDAAPLSQLQTDGFRMVRFFPGMQGWHPDYVPFQNLVEHIAPQGLPIMISVETAGGISDLMRSLKGYSGAVLLSNVNTSSLAEAICALKAFPNWHIGISHLLAPGCIKIAASRVGADRLLFGSGAPARPISSVLHTLRLSGVGENDRMQIISGNARRLLNLGVS